MRVLWNTASWYLLTSPEGPFMDPGRFREPLTELLSRLKCEVSVTSNYLTADYQIAGYSHFGHVVTFDLF